VHIKGYHKERVRYWVTGSSLRINLGAGFKDLFTDEGNRIIAIFKLSEDCLWELFYKEDEQSRYCLRKKSAKYVESYVIALNVRPSTLPRRIIIDVLMTIYL
jgi:hypothetical protein